MDYIENTTSPNIKYCYGDKQSDQDILTIDFYINEYNDNNTILNNIRYWLYQDTTKKFFYL